MNKHKLRLIGLFALLSLVFAFALQNVAVVEVQFLFWGLALPRSLLIFVVLVIGIVVGWFLRTGLGRHRQ